MKRRCRKIVTVMRQYGSGIVQSVDIRRRFEMTPECVTMSLDEYLKLIKSELKTTLCPKQDFDECTTRCAACEEGYCKEYEKCVTPKEELE